MQTATCMKSKKRMAIRQEYRKLPPPRSANYAELTRNFCVASAVRLDISAQLIFGRRTQKEEIMLHLIWYVIVGFLAGCVAKALLHTHLSITWTTCLELWAQLSAVP